MIVEDFPTDTVLLRRRGRQLERLLSSWHSGEVKCDAAFDMLIHESAWL